MKSTWKAVERRVANSFGTARTGPQGRNIPDAITGELSIEVKSRQTVPAWLHDAMEQAERNAVEGTTPVVVLHQIGRRYEDDYVIVRMKNVLRGGGE